MVGSIHNRRILVIDDNVAIHADCDRILRPDARAMELRAARAALLGDPPLETVPEVFEVEFADQGHTGLLMVQQAIHDRRPYAVAFVDMRMPPRWDGVETIERLWRVDPDLQVVLCTAFADQEWDYILRRLGHTDQLLILRKPFDVVEVWQLARALTQKWELTQHAKRQLATLTELVEERTQELSALNVQLQRDIARRQQVEAALRQVQDELERRVVERTAALHREIAERQRLELEAQRAAHFALLGRLAAGVSHELRNPLGAVFLYVDLLTEELQNPSLDSATTMTEALTELTQQLKRIEDLVEDYLSLVRAATVERTPQDLGMLLQAWATERAPMAATGGVALRCEGLETLGVVAVHANTLRRALLNLVQNALDAMPQGGTLTLRGRQQDEMVQIDIQDTGSGIPPEDHARIFDPLHTTKPGGTGLGLYIVQEVLAAHGGQVAVRSASGHGSTFTITLPVAQR